jgi:hypothetical protein
LIGYSAFSVGVSKFLIDFWAKSGKSDFWAKIVGKYVETRKTRFWQGCRYLATVWKEVKKFLGVT